MTTAFTQVEKELMIFAFVADLEPGKQIYSKEIPEANAGKKITDFLENKIVKDFLGPWKLALALHDKRTAWHPEGLEVSSISSYIYAGPIPGDTDW